MLVQDAVNSKINPIITSLTMNFNKLKQHLLYGLKLYSLTLVLPVTLTFVAILVVGIIGIKTNIGLVDIIYTIWGEYYITGIFLGASVWRWHLGLIILCPVISILEGSK